MLEPIENYLRAEKLEPDTDVVLRGLPLDVEGLLRNADDARGRFSWRGAPLVAVSAEATVGGRAVEDLLAGPRLRTRRRYAKAHAREILDAGFVLLPTFAAAHYDIVLGAYTEADARRLLDLFGEAQPNPFYLRRQR